MSNRKTIKKAVDIKNGCQTAKKRKKQKKCTTEAAFAVDVAVRRSCGCGVRGRVRCLRRVVTAGRYWVWGRHCWSLLGAGSCCCVLCCAFSPLRFCNRISGRVGSGQPNTYRAKNKKKSAIRSFPQFCHDHHGAAIHNPPCHCYLVAFFQISTTLFCHGAAMAAI